MALKCCDLSIFGKLWMSKGALTWIVWSYSVEANDFIEPFSQ